MNRLALRMAFVTVPILVTAFALGLAQEGTSTDQPSRDQQPSREEERKKQPTETEREITEADKEIAEAEKQSALYGNVAELWGIASQLHGADQLGQERLLFDRPRTASPATPLFEKIMGLCSVEGIVPHLFEMLESGSSSAPMREAIVYGISNIPQRDGVVEGFENVLMDPDSMAKYPERVRVAVVNSLLHTLALRSQQPSEKLIEHVMENDLAPRVRLFVLQELGQFGKAWYPLLSKNIRSEEKDLRYGAMEGLQIMLVHGHITGQELAKELKWLIENETDENNQMLAVMMYGTHLKGKQHEDFLYEIAGDTEVEYGVDAIEAAVDGLMKHGQDRERVFGMLEKLATWHGHDPTSHEAALGAIATWPGDRKKALETLEKILAHARKYDEENAQGYKEHEERTQGQRIVPLLQIVHQTIANRMRFVPCKETVKFMERLFYETPFDKAIRDLPYRMVECVQDDETKAMLEKMSYEYPHSCGYYHAMTAYSRLVGMEADEFFKQLVLKTRDDARRREAFDVLGRRGFDFGPRCKALETLKYFKKIEALSHLSADIDKAIANAEMYKLENFTAYLDAIDKLHNYWCAVWMDKNPDNPAIKAGMHTDRARQRARSLRGLYDKYFELDQKEQKEQR